MKFILFSFVATKQLRSPGTDVLSGHLTNIVENYVATYERHEDDCNRQEKDMQNLLAAAMDDQSRNSIFNEKIKLSKACHKVLEGKATMIKTLDEAMKTLKPHENWLDQHPELGSKVDKIFSEHPAATAMVEKTKDINKLQLDAVEEMLK